ncbi:MAG: hypothetical protein PVH45_03210, partial [Candidatus Omnitrophota bacterium]
KKAWKRPVLKGAFHILIVPVLILQSAWSGYYFSQDFRYLLKGEQRGEHLDYTYGIAEFLKSKDIEKERILLVGDDAVFYLPENTIRERTFRNFTKYDRHADKIGILRTHNIKYVLMKENGKAKKGPGYDPFSYFRSEMGRDLVVIDGYQGKYDYILCRIKE